MIKTLRRIFLTDRLPGLNARRNLYGLLGTGRGEGGGEAGSGTNDLHVPSAETGKTATAVIIVIK